MKCGFFGTLLKHPGEALDSRCDTWMMSLGIIHVFHFNELDLAKVLSRKALRKHVGLEQ